MRKSFLIFGAAPFLIILLAATYFLYRLKGGEEFVYQRNHPQVIKAILDPGPRDVGLLMTEELENIRALGANTIYVYVDYSYENGQFQYTSGGGRSSNQSDLERDYIDLIKLIKQKGFAVHLALAFGGGSNTSFGVSLETLLSDIREAALKWAAIGEQYQVETYAPSSEIDYQIFREYYGADWEDTAGHREAAETSNRYHSDILPQLREVFKGKLIYQAGLYSAYLGSAGYDLFGQGVNNVGVDLADWRSQVKELFGYAQTNAKRQGSGWVVTELWLPTYERGAEPGTLGPAIKTPSGTPVPDIQDDFYRIVFEEYLAWDGEIKPSGLGFTAYLNSLMAVKGTPAEEVISEFFNLSLLLP